MIRALRRRILYVLIALDIAALALVTLGGSEPGETLSGAAYRTERKGRFWGRVFRPVIDALFRLFGERDHCRDAWMYDLARLRRHPDIRPEL